MSKNVEFTSEQLLAIEQLKAVLKKMAQLEIHISGVTDYEVIAQRDAESSLYVSIS